MSSTLNAALQNSWLFSDLNFDELTQLAAISSSEKFPDKMTLLQAGQKNDSLWVLVHGQVSVHKKIGEKAVATLEAGDIFGEMSWLDGNPASSFIVAQGPCEVLRLRFQKLNDFLDGNPELHIQILRKFAINLSHRLR